MVNKSSLLDLYQATHECVDLLLAHAAGMPAALFVKNVKGVGVPSVRDQLVHTMSSESAWVNLLQYRPFTRLVPTAYPTAISVVQAKEDVMARTLEYFSGLDEATFNTVLAERPELWVGPLRSPAFILQHIITHAFHHKGQIVTLFRMLEHPIGDTDLQRA